MSTNTTTIRKKKKPVAQSAAIDAFEVVVDQSDTVVGRALRSRQATIMTVANNSIGSKRVELAAQVDPHAGTAMALTEGTATFFRDTEESLRISGKDHIQIDAGGVLALKELEIAKQQELSHLTCALARAKGMITTDQADQIHAALSSNEGSGASALIAYVSARHGLDVGNEAMAVEMYPSELARGLFDTSFN